MSSPGDLLFGKIALQYAFLTKEQLDDCFQEQTRLLPTRTAIPLRDITLIKGYLSLAQHQMVLKTRLFTEMRLEDKELARFVVAQRWLTPEQISQLFQEQENYFREKGALIRLAALICQSGLLPRKFFPLLTKVNTQLSKPPPALADPLIKDDPTPQDLGIDLEPVSRSEEDPPTRLCPQCQRLVSGTNGIACPYCYWQQRLVRASWIAVVLALLIFCWPQGRLTLPCCTPTGQVLALRNDRLYQESEEGQPYFWGTWQQGSALLALRRSSSLYWLPAQLRQALIQGLPGGGLLILLCLSAPLLALLTWLARSNPWLLGCGPAVLLGLTAFFLWHIGLVQAPSFFLIVLFYLSAILAATALGLGLSLGPQRCLRLLALSGAGILLLLLPQPCFYSPTPGHSLAALPLLLVLLCGAAAGLTLLWLVIDTPLVARGALGCYLAWAITYLMELNIHFWRVQPFTAHSMVVWGSLILQLLQVAWLPGLLLASLVLSYLQGRQPSTSLAGLPTSDYESEFWKLEKLTSLSNISRV